MNLPECSNQNISKCTKIFFFRVGTKKVFTKIQCPINFIFARIYFKRGGGGKYPLSPMFAFGTN